MQWIFATVIDVFLRFLEISFKQDPRFANNAAGDDEDFFSSNSSSDDPNHPGNSKDNQAKLQAAYKFMELSPPSPSPSPSPSPPNGNSNSNSNSITQEQVKKQYKRLSLRYHPDRNGGSKESQELMQKLNACMDLIEKDLAGVTGENDDDDHHHDHPDDKKKGDGDDDDEDENPMEKYKRMRREMQKEMEEEMKRQQQLQKQFEAKKRQEKTDCAKRAKQLNLETPDGRKQANEKFCQQVQSKNQQQQHEHQQEKQQQQQKQKQKQKQKQQKTASPSSESEPTSSSMDDIDDHQDDDNKKQKEESSTAGNNTNKDDQDPTDATTTTTAKPRNDIMDCNANDVVVALRMGMPDIAISLLQAQLQEFFQEKARNMHFEDEKQSPQQCRLEFLQQPLDMDNNAFLHYAVYYESYQAVKAICQVALKDKLLEKVISQPNRHGQTPLFFAEIAQDESSILPLIKSQVQLAEQILQRTRLMPALKAATKRIVAIMQHIGVATTLSTALSFYIARVVFDLHLATSLVGLMMMQYLGADHRTPSEIPGVPSVTVLLTFCGMWKLAAITIAFVAQFVMFELAAIMAPITIAGLCSSGRKRGGGVMGNLLLPFTTHAAVCRRVEPVFDFVHGYITPKIVTKRGWVRPYFLSLAVLISFGIQRSIGR